jgi:hypothetical protein
VVDQFRWYHWHKLKEQSVANPDLRAGVARWAARRLLDDDDYPAQLLLVMATTEILAPEVDADVEPVRGEEVLYAEVLEGPP